MSEKHKAKLHVAGYPSGVRHWHQRLAVRGARLRARFAVLSNHMLLQLRHMQMVYILIDSLRDVERHVAWQSYRFK